MTQKNQIVFGHSFSTMGSVNYYAKVQWNFKLHKAWKVFESRELVGNNQITF